jgi:single-strand DNA-binding protein
MNKVFLIGNLTKNPELSKTTGDISYCRMSIAVNRSYGENEADYFNIIAWRGLAETCGKYLSKGKKICVVGHLQTRSYEHDGIKKYVTEIVAEEIEFLSPKAENETKNNQFEDEDLPF